MAKKLTPAHIEVLNTVVEYGGFAVYATQLSECGDLVRMGYVRAEDDYEGPRMFPTEAGKRAYRRLCTRAAVGTPGERTSHIAGSE